MAQAQSSIFIGYRRDDTADVAGRVYDRLQHKFGPNAVFKDVDNLPIGTDFGVYILSVLPRCHVFLAMIGPHWIDARADDGTRRLDNPEDWVRIELEAALKTPGLQVVPVLANGAQMPRREQLPETLRALPTLNAAQVRRDPDFNRDMDRLMEAIETRARTGAAATVRQVLETVAPGPKRAPADDDKKPNRAAPIAAIVAVIIVAALTAGWFVLKPKAADPCSVPEEQRPLSCLPQQ